MGNRVKSCSFYSALRHHVRGEVQAGLPVRQEVREHSAGGEKNTVRKVILKEQKTREN